MSYKQRKVMKALRKRGFKVQRQGGRHTIVADSSGTEIAIPRKVELRRGTVRSIAKDAGTE